jgi:MYXO-CTERM domain-containing protein
VTITLDLSGTFDEAAREAFLRRLLVDSIVEYGPDTAYAVAAPAAVTAVPEPAGAAFATAGALALFARRRRKV